MRGMMTKMMPKSDEIEECMRERLEYTFHAVSCFIQMTAAKYLYCGANFQADTDPTHTRSLRERERELKEKV